MTAVERDMKLEAKGKTYDTPSPEEQKLIDMRNAMDNKDVHGFPFGCNYAFVYGCDPN